MSREIATIDVSEIGAVGEFQPLRFEWVTDGSGRFRLLRYSLAGEVQPLGIRFDLEKRDAAGHVVKLDDLENPVHEAALQRLIPALSALLHRHAGR